MSKSRPKEVGVVLTADILSQIDLRLTRQDVIDLVIDEKRSQLEYELELKQQELKNAKNHVVLLESQVASISDDISSLTRKSIKVHTELTRRILSSSSEGQVLLAALDKIKKENFE